MLLTFKDKKLRELCEKRAIADKKLGSSCAGKLRTRLADLEAASCIADLVAGRPHPLRGDREGEFAVDLEGGRRLVLAPQNDPVPRKADGGIDWGHVTRVLVVFIGDYHD